MCKLLTAKYKDCKHKETKHYPCFQPGHEFETNTETFGGKCSPCIDKDIKIGEKNDEIRLKDKMIRDKNKDIENLCRYKEFFTSLEAVAKELGHIVDPADGLDIESEDNQSGDQKGKAPLEAEGAFETQDLVQPGNISDHTTQDDGRPVTRSQSRPTEPMPARSHHLYGAMLLFVEALNRCLNLRMISDAEKEHLRYSWLETKKVIDELAEGKSSAVKSLALVKRTPGMTVSAAGVSDEDALSNTTMAASASTTTSHDNSNGLASKKEEIYRSRAAANHGGLARPAPLALEASETRLMTRYITTADYGSLRKAPYLAPGKKSMTIYQTTADGGPRRRDAYLAPGAPWPSQG